MKVFINKRKGSYNGGLIVVAANNVEEAESILLTTFPDEINMYDKAGYICFDENECVTKEHWSYKSDSWEELFNVTAAFEVPTFLAEAGHEE